MRRRASGQVGNFLKPAKRGESHSSEWIAAFELSHASRARSYFWIVTLGLPLHPRLYAATRYAGFLEINQLTV